jgi:hypothetical protein
MDVFIVVDNADHPAYRRPHRVASALTTAPAQGWQVRSVTVLDQSTGLTANYRRSGDPT